MSSNDLNVPNALSYSTRYDMFGSHTVRIEAIPNSKKQNVVDVGDSPLPLDFTITPKNEEYLGLFWAILKDIQKRTPNRMVPPTKTEVESIMGSKNLKNLAKAGLVTLQIINLIDKHGKNPGSRSCVLLTHDGRVYARNKHEKVQSPVEQPGSDSAGLQP